MKLNVEGLGAIEVRDLEGNPFPMKNAWADGPAVLVFLRHFG